ncbi:MAG: ribose-phosphate diphosphokinase [Novosphingobium sp.]|nr:ribose-phosphate diphosphokinase [Novosphingobium sp.]
MAASLHGFPESCGPARRLAQALSIPFAEVGVHRFPDGESVVRVDRPSRTAILYRSLDDPNAKLVELLLAASALRENGAHRVLLVAPYLCYMRQDMAFEPGQAVSQRVVGKLLADHFEAVLTVDPHLHRIHSLAEAMPGTEAISITAAPVLSDALAGLANPVLVGPDAESRQWVEAIAQPFGYEVLVGTKQRSGDRQVAISIDGIGKVAGRPVVLVDDVISSGATLAGAARLLHEAGAASVSALATHCLASTEDLAALERAGIDKVRATDSVPGPVAEIVLSGLLADRIRAHGWLEEH